VAIETPIAGHYSATYNAVADGYTESGFELEQTVKQELSNESDAYGESTIDWVYRGGDAFLTWDSKVYKIGSTAPFWPWGALGVMATTLAPIGRLASAVAQAMVLTATANTPAAATPATLTASKSLLAPNFSGKLLFNSKLRRVPVRLQLLPSESAGTITWFALT
jgi:hypothetical protein